MPKKEYWVQGIYTSVYARARPVLFIVGNYVKTRSYVNSRVLARVLGIDAHSVGCALRVIGWQKDSANVKNRTWRR